MRPLLFVLLWLLPSAAIADDELITVQSAHSAPVTVQRLQEAIVANGWTILGTVDHAAHVAEFGIKIPARTTISFAYMEVWTGLLLPNPTVAVEVPYSVLVWEDSEGVWATRNTIEVYRRRILERHKVKGHFANDLYLKLQEEKLAEMIEKVTR